MKRLRQVLKGALAVAAVAVPWTAGASSHREAPFITENPKVDGTDFYMFKSYEGTGAFNTAARDGYVTILANYQPLQDAYGGPNYFDLDPDALYEIHVDNTGDGVEDLTFQFDFSLALANGGTGVALPIGSTPANTQNVEIPLVVAGAIDNTEATRNVTQNYTLTLVRGDRRTGTTTGPNAGPITNLSGTGTTFKKPLDNIGDKTFSTTNFNYATYANTFISNFDVPGCTATGVQAGTHARVFVGQRQEGFAVNLGEVFDLLNFKLTGGPLTSTTPNAILSPTDLAGNPTERPDQGHNIIAGKNVTTLAIEVPISCLTTSSAQPVIAGWTTSSLRQARVINPTGTFDQPAREGGPWVQVSRLGMPLVNEVVIGLKDKNKFNNSEPANDLANFAKYVQNPTLPELAEIAFGAQGALAPTQFPRADLVTAFLQGLPGATQLPAVGGTVVPFDAVRLNTNPAFGITRRANQVYLGAAGCFDDPTSDTTAPAFNPAHAGCDLQGFPNGRRPGDDVVDVELRVAMGFLLPKAVAPIRAAHLTDGAAVDATVFQDAFPYLNTPTPGSP